MSLSIDVLTTSGSDRVKSLVISHLFQEITDVTWETNKDTLTIVLTKAQEIPWTSLNGAPQKWKTTLSTTMPFTNKIERVRVSTVHDFKVQVWLVHVSGDANETVFTYLKHWQVHRFLCVHVV